MKAGTTSELEETLTWLRDNTAMTLAALCSTSLLDSDTTGNDDNNISQRELTEMISRTGFSTVKLEHIMRSSKNIAAATSPDSVDKARTMETNLQESILPGISSTVPGTRPRAWVYKYNRYDDDYIKLAGFVTQHLRTVDTEQLKCVVLTGQNLSARWISDQLRSENMPVSCYHAGIERFHTWANPEFQEDRDYEDDGGEAELNEWLMSESGVLVTNEVHFRGAEADFVIFVTREWGGAYSSVRSPVTRAVAGLLLITSDKGLDFQELSKNWDVEIVEEGAWETDSETEDSETESEEEREWGDNSFPLLKRPTS